MSDGFVSSTIATQQKTRGDILSLKEEIEKLCGVVTASSESVKELLAIQQSHDERETRLTVMCEDITQIANSVVTMVEDMHRANQLLSESIVQLKLYITAAATVESMVAKVEALGVVIDKHVAVNDDTEA